MQLPKSGIPKQTMSNEYVWHVDGHHLFLNINNDRLEVTAGPCPFGQSEEADCYHAGIGGCVVAFFVNLYGLDCNVGVAPPHPTMEVAWSSEGSPWEIDLVEFVMIPTIDPQFVDWYESVKSD